MAYYEFSITVTAGADPASSSLGCRAFFSESGMYRAANSAPPDGSGGYSTLTFSTAPFINPGKDVDGSELVWFLLEEFNTNADVVASTLIGPYVVSNVGTVVT